MGGMAVKTADWLKEVHRRWHANQPLLEETDPGCGLDALGFGLDMDAAGRYKAPIPLTGAREPGRSRMTSQRSIGVLPRRPPRARGAFLSPSIRAAAACPGLAMGRPSVL